MPAAHLIAAAVAVFIAAVSCKSGLSQEEVDQRIRSTMRARIVQLEEEFRGGIAAVEHRTDWTSPLKPPVKFWVIGIGNCLKR